MANVGSAPSVVPTTTSSHVFARWRSEPDDADDGEDRQQRRRQRERRRRRVAEQRVRRPGSRPPGRSGCRGSAVRSGSHQGAGTGRSVVVRNRVEKKLSLFPANQSARHGSCNDSSCWPPGTENSVPNLAQFTAAWATSGSTPPDERHDRQPHAARASPSAATAPRQHDAAHPDHERHAEPDRRPGQRRRERGGRRADQRRGRR